MDTSIGKLLKYYRESMSLTQVQVASYINSNLYSEDEKKINQSTINKIEKGNKVPTDILKFLQNHFFLFNIDDSLDIFTTAKEVSALLRIDYDNDDAEDLDLEQFFTLQTKDQIIDYLNRFLEHKEKPRRSRFHRKEEKSLESMLCYYPDEIFVDTYNNREQSKESIFDFYDSKGDMNTLATFVLFVAFIYIAKCTDAILTEKRNNKSNLQQLLEALNISIRNDEEIFNLFVCLTDANNWKECNDAAKGKYLVSFAKKDCLYQILQQIFPKYYSQSKMMIPIMKDDPNIPDKDKDFLKDLEKISLSVQDPSNKKMGLTPTVLKYIKHITDNPLQTLFGLFSYYQNSYLPDKKDVNILIKRYQNARWINDISFIDFASLKKELTNIKERVTVSDDSKINFEDLLDASAKYHKLLDLYNKLEQYAK